MALVPGTAMSASGPVVYPSIQVTTSLDPARAYNQPQLMIDPTDPNTLVIAGAQYNTGTCSAFFSKDGGRTWVNPGGVARPAGYGSCVTSDYGPYLGAAFGADGALYMVTTASQQGCQQCANDLVSDRSNDLGYTWSSSIIHKSQSVQFIGVDGTTKTDMEHFSLTRMATDPSNAKYVYAGSRHGSESRPCPTCVVGGNFKPRPYVAVSADGGKTWSDPIDIMANVPRSQIAGAFIPSLAVGPDGTVYAFTRETTPPADKANPFKPGDPAGSPGAGARKFVSISHDHGKTWTTSTLDNSAVACGGNCDNPIVGTVDAHNGNVYAVWAQNRFVNGSALENDAMFSASYNGGKTWTKPTVLNDDSSGLDHMFPGVSVAPNDRIAVAWYDFRNDHLFNPSSTTSNEQYYDVYYTYSNDGGRTWAKNLRVTDRSMNKDAGYTQSSQQGLMGPVAVASGNDATYFAWSDSRAGTVDNPVEDYYFTSASYGVAGGTTVTPAWVWGLLGAVSALTLAGLILVGLSAVSRSRERTREKVGTAP
ncbi:MAG TPA: sialidase family protein [Candidatus Dormibacteraeota bacterium]